MMCGRSTCGASGRAECLLTMAHLFSCNHGKGPIKQNNSHLAEIQQSGGASWAIKNSNGYLNHDNRILLFLFQLPNKFTNPNGAAFRFVNRRGRWGAGCRRRRLMTAILGCVPGHTRCKEHKCVKWQQLQCNSAGVPERGCFFFSSPQYGWES